MGFRIGAIFSRCRGAASKLIAGICSRVGPDRRLIEERSTHCFIARAGARPRDLDAFSAKIIEEVKEGKHTQRSAA